MIYRLLPVPIALPQNSWCIFIFLEMIFSLSSYTTMQHVPFIGNEKGFYPFCFRDWHRQIPVLPPFASLPLNGLFVHLYVSNSHASCLHRFSIIPIRYRLPALPAVLFIPHESSWNPLLLSFIFINMISPSISVILRSQSSRPLHSAPSRERCLSCFSTVSQNASSTITKPISFCKTILPSCPPDHPRATAQPSCPAMPSFCPNAVLTCLHSFIRLPLYLLLTVFTPPISLMIFVATNPWVWWKFKEDTWLHFGGDEWMTLIWGFTSRDG